MKNNKLGAACRKLIDLTGECTKKRCEGQQTVGPCALSQSYCGGRMRICEVQGDRPTCARMAHLGFLPGSELELVCKAGDRECMVRINGSTMSLDAETAKSILVTPLVQAEK
jgi:ferrous iron transport protein A